MESEMFFSASYFFSSPFFFRIHSKFIMGFHFLCFDAVVVVVGPLILCFFFSLPKPEPAPSFRITGPSHSDLYRMYFPRDIIWGRCQRERCLRSRWEIMISMLLKLSTHTQWVDDRWGNFFGWRLSCSDSLSSIRITCPRTVIVI